MTGAQPAEPQTRVQPQARVQPQVNSWPEEPEVDPDQDRIEIPAFLRRQAN